MCNCVARVRRLQCYQSALEMLLRPCQTKQAEVCLHLKLNTIVHDSKSVCVLADCVRISSEQRSTDSECDNWRLVTAAVTGRR